jgi:hypothetical protein
MLRSFPGPALIVNGENDKPNRKREAALLRAAQDGQLQIVKQAGHLCNLEQPEAFTHQVRTFAKGISTAQSQMKLDRARFFLRFRSLTYSGQSGRYL